MASQPIFSTLMRKPLTTPLGWVEARFGGAYAQNWLDLDAERSRSSFDQRHQAVLNLQYTTGQGIGGGTLVGGWRGQLLKEWTFVDAITAGTGLPLTPTDSGVLLAGTGVSGIRADYTGASIYNAPAGLNLNPLAFTAPLRDNLAMRAEIPSPGRLNSL